MRIQGVKGAIDRHFLFGAGASYGAGNVYPKPPPLGNGLFKELVAFSIKWALLPDDAKAEFERKDIIFEAGFDWVRKQQEHLLAPLLNHMAQYFLINFKLLPNNFYTRLVSAAERQPGINCYSTLNYDLLLEDSVFFLKGDIAFSIDEIEKSPVILKVHGAPYFASTVQLKNNIATGFQAIVSSPVKILNREDAIRRWIDDICDSPAMAIYAVGKAVVMCPEYVDSIQHQYAIVTESSKDVFVVGVNYVEHDLHIWRPLIRTAATVHIVNPDCASFDGLVDARGDKSTKLYPLKFGEFVEKIERGEIAAFTPPPH